MRKVKKHEGKDTWWWNEDVQKAIKEKDFYKSWHHARSTSNMAKYKKRQRRMKREPLVKQGGESMMSYTRDYAQRKEKGYLHD